MQRLRSIRRVLALGAVLCVASASFAQNLQLNSPGAGTLLKTVPSPPVQSEESQGPENLLGKRKALVDAPGLKITIFGYEIKGMTVLTPEQAEAVLKPYTGTKKNYQDIIDAAAALRSRLGEAGLFLADVVVPEQNITTGRIELVVLEGRFGNISVEYDKNVTISRRLVETYLAPLKSGGLVTNAVVERALYLVNDLRGVSALSFFKPGTKTGTADLVIRVRKTPLVSGYFDVDTNGAYGTLEKRAGINLDLNNAFHRGDLINFRGFKSFNFKLDSGLTYGRVAGVAPIGNTALRGGLSYANLTYDVLRGASSVVESGVNGEATIVTGFLSYPLVRSRNLNLIAQWQLDRRKLADRIRTANTEDEKEATVQQVTLSGDIRDSLFGGGVNIFSGTVVRGNLDILSPGRKAFDSQTLRTQGSYTKYSLSGSRLQQLSPDWLLYLSVQQQIAVKNLDASEKIVLGGPYGVRAYAPTEGIGDEGTLATAELRRRITWDKIPGNMVVSGFWDFGTVRVNHEPEVGSTTPNKRTIQGYGLGVNWEPPGWYVRASMAWRAPWDSHSLENSSPTRTPRIYFQAVKYF